MEAKPHEDWEIRDYDGIKSYIPDEVPSDVVPGVYEGGFQLWECTMDLLGFLKSYDFNGKCVYEMGCGRGLPGIYCALNGAEKVVLQDYNKEVIEELTMPNCTINNCDQSKIAFSCDSWADIPSRVQDKFDFVLASETIYRKEQLPAFIEAMRHLMNPDGVAIIAAKRMYFGLSGSVFDLIEATKNEMTFKLHQIKTSNIHRDIIVMQNKQ